MRFSQFLCKKLDGERGRQTQLAQDLKVSKSTITAWRNGTKPDFISCLLLAEHFHMDPVQLFRMVEDEMYESVYQRFFSSQRADRVHRRLSEEDLYHSPGHARTHRELQSLLESDTEEARALRTMIRTAFSRAGASRPSSARPAAAPAKDCD